jgi:hypothetical protein
MSLKGRGRAQDGSKGGPEYSVIFRGLCRNTVPSQYAFTIRVHSSSEGLPSSVQPNRPVLDPQLPPPAAPMRSSNSWFARDRHETSSMPGMSGRQWMSA